MKYLGLLCLAGLVTCSCTGNKTENTTPDYTVQGDTIVVSSNSPIQQKLKVSTIKEENFQRNFNVSGVVKAIPTNYAEIASPFAGRITKTFVRLGQKVAKGSPVFEISSPSFFEAGKAYYQTKQEMVLALKNLKREKDLYANKVSAQKDMEEAEVEYELKKKEYENALSALKVFQVNPAKLVLGQPLIVRSPISGEIISDNIVIGQYFKEDAEPVATVADLNKIWVSANVKEKDLPLVRSLDKVRVELVSMPGKEISGRIYHVSEMLNEETRSVEVLIECDNSDRTMKPGMYGSVKMMDKATNAILIPTSAILQHKDHPYVLVAVGNHAYVKRIVTTSITDGGRTVVLSGIKAGDSVVTGGAFYLIDAR
ncbi:efflux RND transporter periplasmic adaptor subunit [Bacteroidaceae bacterium HV4-6-C5C]|jgi:RND family efflux transporter, MFP subunit|nr:efflux RND transporter periplasmic adaptor subunit [Bacteroidaceae bacterium HV4-6-C5C]